jgi:predicted solute-binding protein
VPEEQKNVVGVSEASYLRPLWYGLKDSEGDLALRVEIPGQLPIDLQQRTGNLRCAFLSPIDYARHGGDYCIVPGVGVSSVNRSNTIQLFVNPDVHDIEKIAVDIRVTSEIVLAKIILAEKYPNRESSKKTLQFIPMLPNRDEMLRKADAALIVNLHPVEDVEEVPFALDLVEEWYDMTGLPYVHGCWVGHDEEDLGGVVRELLRSKDRGVAHLGQIADMLAAEKNLSRQFVLQYLSNFSYDFGELEHESMIEFMKYAYFHGILPDVPGLRFFEVGPLPSPSYN